MEEINNKLSSVALRKIHVQKGKEIVIQMLNAWEILFVELTIVILQYSHPKIPTVARKVRRYFYTHIDTGLDVNAPLIS
jgi:hypothetical protein